MKRGHAVWITQENHGAPVRQLAVFLGEDLNGNPIVQIPGYSPVFGTWGTVDAVLDPDAN